MPLDPQLVPILETLEARAAPPIQDVPLELARRHARATPMLPVPWIEVGEARELALPGPGGDIRAHLYRPAGSGPHAVLLWLHGGGWVMPWTPGNDACCRLLCRDAGVVVLAPEYRLAPEHPFPAALQDARAALEHVAAGGLGAGVDPARICVGGSSAGGNLAAALCLEARDRGGPTPTRQLLLYPALDATLEHASIEENRDGPLLTSEQLAWFWDRYLPPGTDRRDPLCSPLHARSLAGLPPALVISADLDPLRDEAEAYARRLVAAGVPVRLTRYTGVVHGAALLLGQLDAGRAMLEQCAAELAAAG